MLIKICRCLLSCLVNHLSQKFHSPFLKNTISKQGGVVFFVVVILLLSSFLNIVLLKRLVKVIVWKWGESAWKFEQIHTMLISNYTPICIFFIFLFFFCFYLFLKGSNPGTEREERRVEGGEEHRFVEDWSGTCRCCLLRLPRRHSVPSHLKGAR